MAAKVLFLLGFLIVQVSCGKNSLTFVIDNTGSMYDDIRQVRNAAKSILDVVLTEKSSQIEDIVLVTFNDPGFKLVKKTRDENKLREALDSIQVDGGGDCPEMSLSGIQEGLSESRPGSYLYIFTDASAKDYAKVDEIITLAQEKQSQIVFVLTGYCNDRTEESYKVYHKIAAASNGQVFDISKHEVGKVLQYVKETIRGDGDVIESKVIPANTKKDIEFTIDDQTEYAIVSASGAGVTLSVLDPKSYVIGGVRITWLENVKILKLANLSPGIYKARVEGNSEVNIMIFGRTDFTFEHGFTTEAKTSLKATDPQPTTGVKTHLMVTLTTSNSVNIREVELRDMSDRVVMRLPLTLVAGDVYKTEKFLSPQHTFKIAVVGTSKNSGKQVTRLAKTPVTPIQSVAPEIIKSDKLVKVKDGGKVDLSCRINKGKPTPQISWYVKKQGATGFTQLAYTDGVIQVTNARTNDQYKCVAKNVAGRDEHTRQLDVQVSPKFPNKHEVITKQEGEKTTINCDVQKGNPRPTFTWEYMRRGSDSFTAIRHEGSVLNIAASQDSDFGQYRCVANNAEGWDAKITELVVKSKPALEKLTPVKSLSEGTTVNLHCSATKGFPKPTITWFYKGPHSTNYESKNTDHIRIENVQLNDAGQYMCVAENEVGRDRQIVQLVVNVSPKFPNKHEVITKKEGEKATINCEVQKGNPRPTITWEYKRRGSDSFKAMRHEGSLLNIAASQDSHFGHYRCVASNAEGSDEKITELVVKSKPAVEKLPPVTSVMENTTVNLHCSATKGFPKPTITWFYKGPHSTNYESKNTDHIRIENVQLSDAGQYMCVAENEVGRDQQIVQLVVNAPPRIVFEPPNTPEFDGVEGDAAVRLPCAAVGHPKPTITWKVDKRVIGTDKSEGLYVEGNTLFLLHPKSADSTTNESHSYDCHAENKFGDVVQPYSVFIDGFIDFKKPNETQYGTIGQPFDVVCPLPFDDPSSVRWYKGNKELNRTGPKLHFVNGDIMYDGNYTCRVSDLKGRPVSQTLKVIFGQAPEQDDTLSNIKWTGEEKQLLVKFDVYPIPDGKYEWFYNGQKIEDAHGATTTLKTSNFGDYTCRISNPFGNLSLTWKVKNSKDCGITKSLLKKNNAPLMLDSSLSWPKLSILGQHILVPNSEKLQLICPAVSNVKTGSNNGFNKFPTLKSVYATCDHEDIFLIEGVAHKISELDCKQSVTPSVVRTGKQCMGKNTEMMKVGFHVNGFTDVYQACIDKIKNVPLYTKMNTIPIEDRDVPSGSEVKTKQVCSDACCYEKIQLVSPEDVSFGPAQKATTFMDSLNSVNYCKPENGSNWYEMEKIARKPYEFTVWAGASQYTKIGATWTPKYLWKVLKAEGGSEKVVVVHENVATPSPKLCSGKCGEEYVLLFEPSGDRTYCCSLADFKTAFGVTIDFDEN